MKKGFWDKFEDLMEAIPDFIDETMDKVSGGNSVNQTTVNGHSTTKIIQGRNKIVIETLENKLVIKVNGKEWAEKK